MKEKTKIMLLCFMFGLVIVFIMGISYCYSTENISFNKEKVTDYNLNWEYKYGNDEWKPVTLPNKIPVSKGASVTIRNKIPFIEDDSMNLCFCIRTSQQALSIKINGKIIYEYGTDSRLFSGKSPGSIWNIVRIPNDTAGEIIEITYTSPYKNTSGLFNSIFYGSKAAIIFKLWQEYGFKFVSSILLIIMGIFLIILYVECHKVIKASVNILHLGIFVIFISLWFLGESRMLQFISGNQSFVSQIAFWMIQLFPIPLVMFIEETYVSHYKLFLKLSTYLLIVNFFVLSILHVTGICDFYESLAVTQISIFISVVLCTVALIMEIIKYKSKRVLVFLMIFSVVVICAIIELVEYALNNRHNTSKVLFIGLLIFTVFLMMSLVRKIKSMLEESKKIQYYERLAYEDLLVKGKNRTAYYKDVEAKFENVKYINNFILILFDLNDLKKINDKYGHQCGDEALKKCFLCIKSTFGKLGECYRIGGDEFACLCFETNIESIKEEEKNFLNKIEEVNKETLYDFDIAYGYGLFDPEIDNCFDDFSNRIDKYMYKTKNKSKEQNRIN